MSITDGGSNPSPAASDKHPLPANSSSSLPPPPKCGPSHHSGFCSPLFYISAPHCPHSHTFNFVLRGKLLSACHASISDHNTLESACLKCTPASVYEELCPLLSYSINGTNILPDPKTATFNSSSCTVKLCFWTLNNANSHTAFLETSSS